MDPSQREVRTMLYFSYFHHSFRTGSGTLSSARAARSRNKESVNAKRANLVDARSPALLLCCVSHLILGDDRRRAVLGAAMAGLTLLDLEACWLTNVAAWKCTLQLADVPSRSAIVLTRKRIVLCYRVGLGGLVRIINYISRNKILV